MWRAGRTNGAGKGGIGGMMSNGSTDSEEVEQGRQRDAMMQLKPAC